MRKFFLSIAVLVAYTAGAFAQTAAAPKTYQMVQIMMIKPKQGQEKAFEDAVKAHDAKFHSGAYAAQLWAVTYGKGSDGWYVWRMGPLMYTDMDKQPQGNKDHDDDWSKTVDPHVQEYGETNFWKLQDDLSYTPANYNPQNLDVWIIDIKPGMRYQFADLMKKWKAMWEAKKYPYAMRVSYNDMFSGDGGADAGIVFSFNHFAEFDDPNNDWRKDYEEMNGPGSWDNFWKAWNACVNSTSEQIRALVK
ncbi:MAG TPA: hypothetical protein VE978_17845 [Chitinophagales bacterium]|nr:hypothetical protein [Chitinophagales bacterium]